MPRRLGQHFLKNSYIAKKIINFADIRGKSVVEIGAGKGILTRELSKQAKIVFAYEIDSKYATKLKEKNLSNVNIINADFLKCDLSKYAGSVIVGNIPYGITTSIIEKLVRGRKNLIKAVLTIQKEYGERLFAKPASPQYSSITCYVNYYFNVIRGFVIPPKYFSPPPKVSSIVIGLICKEPPFPLKDESDFFNFIKGVFQYRRKTLKNAMLNYLGYKPEDLNCNILSRRPEQLELMDFYRLYNYIRVEKPIF